MIFELCCFIHSVIRTTSFEGPETWISLKKAVRRILDMKKLLGITLGLALSLSAQADVNCSLDTSDLATAREVQLNLSTNGTYSLEYVNYTMSERFGIVAGRTVILKNLNCTTSNKAKLTEYSCKSENGEKLSLTQDVKVQYISVPRVDQEGTIDLKYSGVRTVETELDSISIDYVRKNGSASSYSNIKISNCNGL